MGVCKWTGGFCSGWEVQEGSGCEAELGDQWNGRERSEAEGVCDKSYKFRAKMGLFLSFF